jgi:thiamine biosynthesis protein ThiS
MRRVSCIFTVEAGTYNLKYECSDMEITLNGKPHPIEQELSITALLESLDTHPQTVVVEVNGDIVRRPHYDTSMIHAGDTLEVVRFYPGG